MEGIRAAILLVGGQSRRMGIDKGTLRWHGRTFLESATCRLRTRFDLVVLVVRDPQMESQFRAMLTETVDVRWVHDQNPGEGPLEGLVSGLESLRSDSVDQDSWILVTTVDLPGIDPRFGDRLLARAATGDELILPQRGGQSLGFPLLVRSNLAGRLRNALTGGVRRILELPQLGKCRFVELDDQFDDGGANRRWLRPLNTVEEYEAFCRECAWEEPTGS